jgi:hypothetical protein
MFERVGDALSDLAAMCSAVRAGGIGGSIAPELPERNCET